MLLFMAVQSFKEMSHDLNSKRANDKIKRP